MKNDCRFKNFAVIVIKKLLFCTIYTSKNTTRLTGTETFHVIDIRPPPSPSWDGGGTPQCRLFLQSRLNFKPKDPSHLQYSFQDQTFTFYFLSQTCRRLETGKIRPQCQLELYNFVTFRFLLQDRLDSSRVEEANRGIRSWLLFGKPNPVDDNKLSWIFDCYRIKKIYFFIRRKAWMLFAKSYKSK